MYRVVCFIVGTNVPSHNFAALSTPGPNFKHPVNCGLK
jgi:hypothetical protein